MIKISDPQIGRRCGGGFSGVFSVMPQEQRCSPLPSALSLLVSGMNKGKKRVPAHVSSVGRAARGSRTDELSGNNLKRDA